MNNCLNFKKIVLSMLMVVSMLSPLAVLSAGYDFSENFDGAGAADRFISQWTTYCGGEGEWFIEDDKLRVNPGISGDKALINGTENLTNFVIDMDVTTPESQTQTAISILFRVQNPAVGTDEMKGYSAWLRLANASGNGYVGVEKINVDSTPKQQQLLASAAAYNGMSFNTQYHMRVVVFGSTIRVYVNDMGRPLVWVTDSEFTSGSIGVSVRNTINSTDSAAFDNITIRSLDNEVNPKLTMDLNFENEGSTGQATVAGANAIELYDSHSQTSFGDIGGAIANRENWKRAKYSEYDMSELGKLVDPQATFNGKGLNTSEGSVYIQRPEQKAGVGIGQQTNFTFFTRLKRNADDSDAGTRILASSDNASNGWEISVNPSGQLVLYMASEKSVVPEGEGGILRYFNYTTPESYLAKGQWRDIAMSFADTGQGSERLQTLKLYVDGDMVFERSTENVNQLCAPVGNGHLLLGGNSGAATNTLLKATYDTVKLYNCVLSDVEIKALTGEILPLHLTGSYSIGQDGEVLANVTVGNYLEQNTMVIVALYNKSNGKLVDLWVHNQPLNIGTNRFESIALDSGSLSEQEFVVKGTIWDTVENMVPLLSVFKNLETATEIE